MSTKRQMFAGTGRSGSRILRHLVAVLVLAIAPLASAQQSFDHFSTGFELEGAHLNVSCDRCHTGGIFEGTTRSCAGWYPAAS